MDLTKIIADLRWCRENYERARTVPAIDAAIELLSVQKTSARPGLSDGTIREIVNQLRDIAIEFRETQQLRARFASVIVPRLQAATPQPAPATFAAILTTGQILALEPRSGMNDDEALRYARSVELAVLRAQAAKQHPVSAAQPAPATGDEREAFEAWARGRGRGHMLGRAGGHDDFYADPRAQAWWTVWQASAAHRREDQRDSERVVRDAVEQFKAALYRVPGFGNRVNKEVREKLTEAHCIILNLPALLDHAAMQRTAAPAHGEQL